MMVEQATVIRYQQGIATVQCQAKSGCGSCNAQSTCGSKALSALAGEKFAPQFELDVPCDLQVGDIVEIGLSEQRLLSSLFWLYCLPLLMVVGSTLLFSQWIENELTLALIIFTVTALTFMGVKKMIQCKEQGQFIPVFLRKV